MIYWTPANKETKSVTPLSGWSSSFSEKDKIQYTNLFFFFKNKKGFKENIAEMMAQMVLYKQKYAGMKYSDEQEAMLEEALKPVFNS
jgi:predicted adenine nucleotide alpha hydrolase (AANH) superfamily ATPase